MESGDEANGELLTGEKILAIMIAWWSTFPFLITRDAL